MQAIVLTSRYITGPGPNLSGRISLNSGACGGSTFIFISPKEHFNLEHRGKHGSWTLSFGISTLDDNKRLVIIQLRGNDVARGYLLKIDDEVRLEYAEGLLDPETKTPPQAPVDLAT